GDPGWIRTSDPQLRRLGDYKVSQGLRCKTAPERRKSDQRVASGLQNRRGSIRAWRSGDPPAPTPVKKYREPGFAEQLARETFREARGWRRQRSAHADWAWKPTGTG